MISARTAPRRRAAGDEPAADQLTAVMAISAVVAEAGALDDTLDQIAFAAAAPAHPGPG